MSMFDECSGPTNLELPPLNLELPPLKILTDWSNLECRRGPNASPVHRSSANPQSLRVSLCATSPPRAAFGKRLLEPSPEAVAAIEGKRLRRTASCRRVSFSEELTTVFEYVKETPVDDEPMEPAEAESEAESSGSSSSDGDGTGSSQTRRPRDAAVGGLDAGTDTVDAGAHTDAAAIAEAGSLPAAPASA